MAAESLDAPNRPALGDLAGLEAEGTLWDGPVALTGGAQDLPARLIVTPQRIALLGGLDIMLEAPRAWLSPAPYLGFDGTVFIQLDPDNTGNPERLMLQIEEGRQRAASLVSLIGGATIRTGRPRPIATEPSSPAPAAPLSFHQRVPPVPAAARPSWQDASSVAAEPPADDADVSPLRRLIDQGRARSSAAPATPKPSAPPQTGLAQYAILDPDQFPPLTARPTSSRPAGGFEDAPAIRASRPHEESSALERLLADVGYGTGAAPAPVPVAEVAAAREPSRTLQPIPELATRRPPGRRANGLLRVSILVAIVIAATAFGSGRIDRLPFRTVSDLNAPFASEQTPTAAAVAQVTTSAPAVNATAASRQTAIALGIGGPTGTVKAAEPTSPASVVPTATPDPAISPTRSAAVLWATATPRETTTTTAPAETATAPAAETATASAPATPSPTATPTTPSSPTPTPELVFPTQTSSLATGTLPSQRFAAGTVLFTIDAAAREASNLTIGLDETYGIDWVWLVVTAENTGDAEVTVGSSDFFLTESGPTATEDVPTTWQSGLVAQSLGLNDSTPGNALAVAPGESVRFALAYRVYANAEVITLTFGEQLIDLAPSLSKPVATSEIGTDDLIPAMVKAKVTRVIDGRTIEVSANGATATVRYIGIDVPGLDACFGMEAKAANAELVKGKTVWLEREWRDSSRDGTLLRDVWVEDGNGNLVLVARELTRAGFASPAPTDPDIRYAGWISGAMAVAVFEEAGIWAECGGVGGEIRAHAPSTRQVTAARRDPIHLA